MKNPMIFKNGYFLGRWLRSKALEFKDLSDEQKLQYLNELITDTDREKHRRKLVDSVHDAMDEYIQFAKNSTEYGGSVLRKNAENIKAAIDNYLVRYKELDDFDDKYYH